MMNVDIVPYSAAEPTRLNGSIFSSDIASPYTPKNYKSNLCLGKQYQARSPLGNFEQIAEYTEKPILPQKIHTGQPSPKSP